MRLPCDRIILSRLCREDLLRAVIERRTVIREHRDARLDERCYRDDWLVWVMLDDTPTEPTVLLPTEEAMVDCNNFFIFRNAETADPTPRNAILERTRWDEDLRAMTSLQLLDELMKLQEAILRHRDIFDRPRTADDDRALYSVMPEKIPADFRLPPREEFLGEAKAPHAGCPAFWKSHANCRTDCHNFHKWGPCR